MRLCKRKVDEGYYMFELDGRDYTKIEDNEHDEEVKVCVVCGRRATERLVVTDETFCLLHAMMNVSIALPDTHPACVEAEEKWRKRKSLAKRPKRAERILAMVDEVLSCEKADQEMINKIAVKYDLTAEDFLKNRHLRSKKESAIKAKDMPLGSTKEDLARIKESSDEVKELEKFLELRESFKDRKETRSKEERYFLEVAVLEVVVEGRDINEVCEEFDVNIEEVRNKIERIKGE